MKLPNPEHAVVDIRKLRDYCLNADHQEGKHKARVFVAALGVMENRAEWLCDRLLEAALQEDAALVSDTRFGSLYVLDFDLKTLVGAATIRSGWIVRRDESIPRLTTCYVRKTK
jgi:hypothetical protein